MLQLLTDEMCALSASEAAASADDGPAYPLSSSNRSPDSGVLGLGRTDAAPAYALGSSNRASKLGLLGLGHSVNEEGQATTTPRPVEPPRLAHLLCLLLSLCGLPAAARALGDPACLAALGRLARLGGTRDACLAMRLLRLALPTVSPAAARLLSDDPAADAQRSDVGCSLLEAVGREAMGTSPTVAAGRCRGQPDGPVCNELVGLCRHLRACGSRQWGDEMGGALHSGLGALPGLLDALAADQPAPAAHLVLGTLAVLGAHVPCLYVGGPVRADGARSAVLLQARAGSCLLASAVEGESTACLTVNAANVTPTDPLPPSEEGLDLAVAIPQLSAALGVETTLRPLLAVVHAWRTRVLRGLLSRSACAEAAAGRLLHAGALPLLLELAVTPLHLPPAHAVVPPDVLAMRAAAAVAARAAGAAWPGTLALTGGSAQEKLLSLLSLGHDASLCVRALEVSGGDESAARECLLSLDDDDDPMPSPPPAEGLARELSRLGFPLALCREALVQSSFDIQAAADFLLSHESKAASGENEPAPPAMGTRLDVRDDCGVWHAAVVLAQRGSLLKLGYEGWPAAWAEWLDAGSSQIRPRTAAARFGPEASASSSEQPAAAEPLEPTARLPSPPTAPARHRQRGQGWFRRGSGAQPRRPAAKQDSASARACPSPDADFFPADTGVARTFELPPPPAAPAGVSPPPHLRPIARLAAAAPCLRGESGLPFLLRYAAVVHTDVARREAREAALALLCHPEWLLAAHDDVRSHFRLSSLGSADRLLKLLKLSATASPDPAPLASHWEALGKLLSDGRLGAAVPGLSNLPRVLAEEAVSSLARVAATGRFLESTHPCSVSQLLQGVGCAGACVLQLCFDGRSKLSRGAKLAIYLDAGCTQQVVSCEGDDLAHCETLWLCTDRVWVHYACAQNRERAWGFKLRVVAGRWRARTEAAALALPYAHGWDLLARLACSAPSALLHPPTLAGLLRYLCCARAPHRERVCDVLARALRPAQLREMCFDWAAFRSLEPHVEWHEELYERQRAPPLLPASSQAMLALLAQIRDQLRVRMGLSLCPPPCIGLCLCPPPCSPRFTCQSFASLKHGRPPNIFG
jgi:hypothetical protein